MGFFVAPALCQAAFSPNTGGGGERELGYLIVSHIVMSQYKRQHWLPVVYLKQFSADGPQSSRTSLIWRLDQ